MKNSYFLIIKTLLPLQVRKRSRTVHREDVRGVEAVEDAGDAAPLPPGRRRFDAVLPDEEGHDIKNSTPARGQRGQRELEDDGQDARDAVNEVAEQGEQGELQVRSVPLLGRATLQDRYLPAAAAIAAASLPPAGPMPLMRRK